MPLLGAGVWWYFRDANAEGAGKLFEQAKKIAQGAALMTNTEAEVQVLAAVWPLRGNRTLAELVQRNIERVGMPAGMTPASKSRFEMILGVKEHEMHHRGQLMLIERMVGLTPHLTREMLARFAANVRGSSCAARLVI